MVKTLLEWADELLSKMLSERTGWVTGWMDNPNPYTVMTTREPALLTIMLICLGQYLSFVVPLAWAVCQNFFTKYKSHLFANGSTASGHLYFSSTSPCNISLFSWC